jgi:CrcB protein
MLNAIVVGFGGFIGATSRYLLSMYINGINLTKFPISTLIINIAGSFLIGLLTQMLTALCPDNKRLQLFLTTGILGGFTTFSTFSLETVNLYQSGLILYAIANVALSIIFCLSGVVLGKNMVQLFIKL